MRKAAIFLVALMVVFAGCSSGGNGGNETDTNSTATPEMDEGDMTPSANDSDGGENTDGDSDTGPDGDSDSNGDDGTDGEPTFETSPMAAANTSEDLFSGSVEVDMTLINGSEQASFLWRNDTQNQLVQLDRPSGSSDTYYITDGGSAYRNSSTGETRYGSGDGRLAGEAALSAFFAFAGFAYIGIMDWEQARTTTVDGQDAIVYEADSLNQSATENTDFQTDGAEIQSATGEMVVTENGLKSASVRITTSEGEAGVDLTITRGGISVSQPSWVDESQFGS